MKRVIRIINSAATTPDYGAAEVNALMRRMELSEKGLALLLNVSPMTVRLWTAGAVKPCGLSRRLLQIYELCPEVIGKLAGDGGDA